MQDNPYRAPDANVADPAGIRPEEQTFSTDPQSHSAGAGATWLGKSWELFKASAGMWIALTIVMVAAAIAIQAIPVAGAIIPGLLYPILTAGLMIGCAELNAGRALRFNHLFAAFGDRFAAMMLFTIIYLVVYQTAALLVFVPFIGLDGYLGMLQGDPGNLDPIALWSALGLNMLVSIPIFAGYWLAVPLIALNQIEPIPAIKMSLMGCLKNILPLFVLGVLWTLVAIAGVIPLGLGLLIVLPMMFASMYASYRAIFYRD